MLQRIQIAKRRENIDYQMSYDRFFFFKLNKLVLSIYLSNADNFARSSRHQIDSHFYTLHFLLRKQGKISSLSNGFSICGL
jgi:hypothetical protein